MFQYAIHQMSATPAAFDALARYTGLLFLLLKKFAFQTLFWIYTLFVNSFYSCQDYFDIFQLLYGD